MVVQRQLVLVQVGGWVVGSRHTTELWKLCTTAQKSITTSLHLGVCCHLQSFRRKVCARKKQFWCIVQCECVDLQQPQLKPEN